MKSKDAENVAVVQAIYDAMAVRDVERLVALVDPTIVITQDDRLPWGGRFEGHDGFVAFAAALTGTIDSAVTTDAMFGADGDVVQVGRTRGTTVAGATPFDIPRFTDGRLATAAQCGHTSRSTPRQCSRRSIRRRIH